MTCKEQGHQQCWRSLARTFTLHAAVLCALFLVAHLLGLRQYTSFLSGTATLNNGSLLGGVFYILLYVLFVVWAPILLIAAALAKTLEFFKSKSIPRKTAGVEE